MKLQRQNVKQQAEVVRKVTEGTWWPFDRVDAKLLEKIHRQKTKPQPKESEEALL